MVLSAKIIPDTAPLRYRLRDATMNKGADGQMAGTQTRIHSDANSPPDLHTYAGEWVVLHDGAVIEHGAELEAIVDKARSRGIQRPRVLFVEGRDRKAVKLGL